MSTGWAVINAERDGRRIEYLFSRERADRFFVGATVQATKAAPPQYWGRLGNVVHIRRPDAGQRDLPAALVDWYRADCPEQMTNATRIVAGRKHYLSELKLWDGEEWDEDAAFPRSAEADAAAEIIPDATIAERKSEDLCGSDLSGGHIISASGASSRGVTMRSAEAEPEPEQVEIGGEEDVC